MNQEPMPQGQTAPNAPYYPAPSASAVTTLNPPTNGGSNGAPKNGSAKSTNGAPAPAPASTTVPLQPIDAHFYNVARNDGSPMAGLIVLVDSKRNPVRAELHLHEGVTDDAGRQAIRQAQHIIEDRYAGPESIPMEVWQSFLRSDRPLPVQLNPDVKATKAATKSTQNASSTTLPGADIVNSPSGKWLMIIGGAILTVALLWGLWAWLGPDNSTATPESGGIGIPSTDAATANESLAPIVDAPADLAVSRNADPNISLGKRVLMSSGSQPVRSEPGANAGAEIGTLNNGNEVLVVGGPEMLAGASDTIVWWEIQLDDDQTGWVAANTSTRSLLEPLE